MNEFYENMDISRARADCAKDLRELKGYIAIDYGLTEDRYGRLDGTKNGEYCESCPVLRDLGKCSLRTMFQELANSHRIKYELSRGGSNRN
jgi:hypothetical protein